MVSKLIIKLIDLSILPAILLISVRIITTIMIGNSQGIALGVTKSGLLVQSLDQYIELNSYSTLYMIIALSLGLIFIIIKAHVFHDTHIHPKTSAELFTFKLHGLIQSSYDLYTQGAIWLSYLYFLTLTSLLMSFSGTIYSWVTLVSILISVVTTVLFIIDIEGEATK